MTRDEFRKKIATPEGRAELGLTLTGDDAAAILADDTQLDQLYADAQARAAAQEHAAGATAAEPAPAAPLPSAPAAQEPQKAKRGLDKTEKSGLWTIVAVVIGLIIIGIISLNLQKPADEADADDDPGSASEPYVAPTPEREYPLLGGYHDAGNGLEWTFGDVKADPDGCSYYNSCVVVNLEAFRNCPGGVYVEGQVLDASGTVIGMTNDTLPALMKGQQGRVKLGYMGKGAAKTRVTEVTCH